jgi:hypothetical protein
VTTRPGAAVARAAVHEIDADQPVGRIRSMQTVVSEAVSKQRFTMCLVGMFAALALGLSLLGLYAVVSLGGRADAGAWRLALGATPVRLLLLVLTEGISLAAVGVVLGLAVAFGLVRVIESQLLASRPTIPRPSWSCRSCSWPQRRWAASFRPAGRCSWIRWLR